MQLLAEEQSKQHLSWWGGLRVAPLMVRRVESGKRDAEVGGIHQQGAKRGKVW